MKKFTSLKSIPAYLPIVNIDTDMIIPKQFLKTIKRTVLCKNLFHEMRYDDDGNNIDEVRNAIQTAKENCFNGKPVVIIMKTIMGNGVNYMMGTHKWHGVAPNDEELEIALNQNPETLNDY